MPQPPACSAWLWGPKTAEAEQWLACTLCFFPSPSLLDVSHYFGKTGAGLSVYRLLTAMVETVLLGQPEIP